MITLAMSLRKFFPAGDFGSPAGIEAIQSAEREIGCAIPSPLRELYLEFDGFYGPTYTHFLYRLGSRDDDSSLVGWNVFFRTGPEFPSDLKFRYLFFGSDGCCGHWAVPVPAGSSIVRWYPDMGDRVEVMAVDLLTFWMQQKRRLDE